ncbi:hypothetical protein BDF14DRAFT_1735744, partial [Spinellus fusiger]
LDLYHCPSLPKGPYTRIRYETTTIKHYTISNNLKEMIKNIVHSESILISHSSVNTWTYCSHILESIEVLSSAKGNTIKKLILDFFHSGEEIDVNVDDTLSESEVCIANNLIRL